MVYSLTHDGSLTEGQPESVIVNPFTDVDDPKAALCTVFAKLRNNFYSRLSLTTALFMSRAASSVGFTSIHF